jgi:dienelactone hydrolase
MSEQTVILGAENHLIATLTPPAAPSSAPPPCIAVLTNSGVIPRSGPHRMNVHLARKFAEMGIPSIRFDLSGLGDSKRSTGTLPMLEQWVVDTRSVMDAAQARFGCDHFFMVGFCSGAEVAHLVALKDKRLRAAVLWDLYSYSTLESKLRAAIYRLRRAGFATAVRKVLGRLGRAAGAMARPRSNEVESAADTSNVPALSDYAKRIQTLVDGGVELLFAYCGGEPERFNHRGQFRGMFGKYAFYDKVAFNFLEISDHLVTRREAQASFTSMVVGWLEQRVLPKAKASAISR